MIYFAEDYNSDPMPETYRTGTQKGNQRFKMMTQEGFRRFVSWSNSHSNKPNMTIEEANFGFPTVPWNEMNCQRKVNRRALEQGIITQADFDYFYG